MFAPGGGGGGQHHGGGPEITDVLGKRNFADADDERVRKRAKQEGIPEIFKGLVISVEGVTNPPARELKHMILRHGGKLQKPNDSRRRINYVVCTSVDSSKKNQHMRYRVVNPQWILQSITAKEPLEWTKFAVQDKSPIQARLDLGGKIHKEKRIEVDYSALNGSYKPKSILTPVEKMDKQRAEAVRKEEIAAALEREAEGGGVRSSQRLRASQRVTKPGGSQEKRLKELPAGNLGVGRRKEEVDAGRKSPRAVAGNNRERVQNVAGNNRERVQNVVGNDGNKDKPVEPSYRGRTRTPEPEPKRLVQNSPLNVRNEAPKEKPRPRLIRDLTPKVRPAERQPLQRKKSSDLRSKVARMEEERLRKEREKTEAQKKQEEMDRLRRDDFEAYCELQIFNKQELKAVQEDRAEEEVDDMDDGYQGGVVNLRFSAEPADDSDTSDHDISDVSHAEVQVAPPIPNDPPRNHDPPVAYTALPEIKKLDQGDFEEYDTQTRSDIKAAYEHHWPPPDWDRMRLHQFERDPAGFRARLQARKAPPRRPQPPAREPVEEVSEAVEPQREEDDERQWASSYGTPPPDSPTDQAIFEYVDRRNQMFEEEGILTQRDPNDNRYNDEDNDKDDTNEKNEEEESPSGSPPTPASETPDSADQITTPEPLEITDIPLPSHLTFRGAPTLGHIFPILKSYMRTFRGIVPPDHQLDEFRRYIALLHEHGEDEFARQAIEIFERACESVSFRLRKGAGEWDEFGERLAREMRVGLKEFRISLT